MTRRETGENYFKQGFNCAQAVALAFADKIGLDEEKIAKLVSPFGGGFGRMREVCGAVSGMLFALGSIEGTGLDSDDEKKLALYQKVQELMKDFKERNGSYICRELLALPEGNSEPTPEKRTESYYKKRPCALLVGDACEILDEYFAKINA
jgi:C_GCAxxG_C_C family probable redox protein